jgi:hypothetical protein
LNGYLQVECISCKLNVYLASWIYIFQVEYISCKLNGFLQVEWISSKLNIYLASCLIIVHLFCFIYMLLLNNILIQKQCDNTVELFKFSDLFFVNKIKRYCRTSYFCFILFTWWFSLVPSTDKTDILLKVALNTINQPSYIICVLSSVPVLPITQLC